MNPATILWLKDNWFAILKYSAILIVVGYLSIANYFLTNTNKEQKQTIENNKVLVKSLNSKLASQNTAIDEWKQTAENNRKEKEKLLQLAKEQSTKQKKKANTIITTKPTTNNDCESANNLINEQL